MNLSSIHHRFESCVRDVFKLKNWNFTSFLDQVKKQQKFDDALQACLCLCLPVQPAALAEKNIATLFSSYEHQRNFIMITFSAFDIWKFLGTVSSNTSDSVHESLYVKDRNNTWGKDEASENCPWALKKNVCLAREEQKITLSLANSVNSKKQLYELWWEK